MTFDKNYRTFRWTKKVPHFCGFLKVIASSSRGTKRFSRILINKKWNWFGKDDRLVDFIRIKTIWVKFWLLSVIYRIFWVNSKSWESTTTWTAWNNCNFNELKLNYYQIHIKGWIHTHYRIVSFLFIPFKPLSRTIRATERVITVLMRSQRGTRVGYPKRYGMNRTEIKLIR